MFIEPSTKFQSYFTRIGMNNNNYCVLISGKTVNVMEKEL